MLTSTFSLNPIGKKEGTSTSSTSSPLSNECLKLSDSLATLGFSDEKEWLIDLNSYFISDELNTSPELSLSQDSAISSSQQTEDISAFLAKVADIISASTAEKPSGYFNFYVSSIFKDTQKEKENKHVIATALKTLLSQLNSHYILSQKPRKCILISEFLSLYPSLGTYESIKSLSNSQTASLATSSTALKLSHQPNHESHSANHSNAFVSAAAHSFMLKYFKFDSTSPLSSATNSVTSTASISPSTASSSAAQTAAAMASAALIGTAGATASANSNGNSSSSKTTDSSLLIPQDATIQLGFDRKIFWCDFAAALERHYSEIMDLKRVQINFAEIITYMKPLIDTNHDNTIDFSEIDAFFTSYNCLTPSHLTSAVESLRYKPATATAAAAAATTTSGSKIAALGGSQSSPALTIELTYIAEASQAFYQSGDQSVVTRMTMNPFYDRIFIGRKNEKEPGFNDKSNQIISLPTKDLKVSRSQLSVFKSDTGQYFLENLNLQLSLHFLVSHKRMLVKEGAIFLIGRKSPTFHPAVFTVDNLLPEHEAFELGTSLLHPTRDLPYIDLAADLDVAKSCASKPQPDDESNKKKSNENLSLTSSISVSNKLIQPPPTYQARFVYKNMNYLCSKKRFTVGNSVQDDVQIDQAVPQHILFEYLDNYGWVVSSTQPEVYMRIPDATQQQQLHSKRTHQTATEEERQHGKERNQQQQESLKYRIFHGLAFSISDYEFTFTYSA